MNNLLKTTIAGAMLIFLAFFWAGCGDEEGGLACIYDSQCGSAEYCITGQCVAACSQDDDCPVNASCEVYQRDGEVDPIQACLDENQDNNGVIECQDDTECQALLNDPQAYCGFHHRCVRASNGGENQTTNGGENNQTGNQTLNQNNEEVARYFLVIEQLSADGTPFVPDDEEGEPDGENSDDGDPGDEDGIDEEPEAEVHPLRIGAVIARNAQDVAVAYGQLLRLESEGDAYGELMEPPVTVDSDKSCVEEPHYAPYAVLGGPGGVAVVELFERTGVGAVILEGWRLQIVAEGRECPLGEPRPDEPMLKFGEYRAFLCVSEHEVFDLEIDCPLEFAGPLSGFADLEVTFSP